MYNIQQHIEELRAERARIDEAIAALERLATGGKRKRGRPAGSKNKPKQASDLIFDFNYKK